MKPFLPFLLSFLSFASCSLPKKQNTAEVYDFEQIKAKGEITAVTLNTSTTYFIYKMQQMGYEYDLVEDLATSLGLELNIRIAENITRLEEMLDAGEVDIVAYPVQMDNTMKTRYLFCGVEQQNHLVIVQRSNRGDTIINDVTGLIGKEIWVKQNSRYHERLMRLNDELGGGIIIRNIGRDTVTVEDMIGMVAAGEIRYTVSDNNVARLNSTYYQNININLSISFPQRASWIVRKDCPELAAKINEWANGISQSPALLATAKRYFEQSKNDFVTDGQQLIIKKGDISPYDDLFRKYAEGTDWDWRLLASIAFEESKFHNHLESWAGAKGLMGIMPSTARSLGVSPDSLENAEISIQAGIKCLSNFNAFFSSIKDRDEKIKFTLAAYNAGNGHILDAQKLASKYGKNPSVWDNNVAEFIRLKSEPEYYNDPVCKHGYLRGIETYKYVGEVLARYKFYKTIKK
ncbi:MAG: transporter substrate-binding domain-containing protein [Tannerella sp.]|jgi:membrane-bound lytic murein transglycosylase F|nr:transporter substrate-binding domain-containing protein [Tannerella sp.]